MPTELTSTGVKFNNGTIQSLSANSNIQVAANGQGWGGAVGHIVTIPINTTQAFVMEFNLWGGSGDNTEIQNTASNFGTSGVKFRKGTFDWTWGSTADTGGVGTHVLFDTPNPFGNTERWCVSNNFDVLAPCVTMGVVTISSPSGNNRMLANGVQFRASSQIQSQGLNTNQNIVANVGWQRIDNVLMMWGSIPTTTSSRVTVNTPVPFSVQTAIIMITPITGSTDTLGSSENAALTLASNGDAYIYNANNDATGFFLSTNNASGGYSWMFAAVISSNAMVPAGGPNGLGI